MFPVTLFMMSLHAELDTQDIFAAACVYILLFQGMNLTEPFIDNFIGRHDLFMELCVTSKSDALESIFLDVEVIEHLQQLMYRMAKQALRKTDIAEYRALFREPFHIASPAQEILYRMEADADIERDADLLHV